MSSENKSPWNDPRITAYVLDELPPDERGAFEKEMAADEALSQAVAGAGEVTGQLSALFKTETTPPLTDHRRAAIINEPVIVRPEDEKTNRAKVIAFLAIAATALALIGLSPMLKTQQVAQVDQVIASDRSADEMEVALSGSRIALNESTPVDSKPESIAQIENQDKSQSISAGYAMAPPAPVMTQSEPQSEAFSKVQMNLSPNIKNVRRKSLQRGRQAFEQDRARIGRQQVDIVEQTRIASTRAAENRPAQSDFKFYTTPRGNKEIAQFGFDSVIGEGRGPGMAGDRFDPIVENEFIRTADHPLSTFSADVDTASYSKVRDFLMRANQMPRPDAVRVEEMVNYFDYADAPPADDAEHPFAARVNITECPWNDGHRLARIAIKGKTMKPKERPNCNLVFLLDTSGSMNAANKLPLVVEGMKMLTGQLTKKDKVAIVVYAGSAGMVLDSTSAKKKKKIRRALENLSAGGSTNGGQGIALAYQTAREHFIEDGVNRVILCTDGDFNVGTTGTDSLVRMVEKEAKDDVYLTVLGFGMGNHNDAMLEQISGRGNGNYAFIDNQREAHKVLVKQTAGTLVTIAKDVKLQVDFNPAKVGAYRLIGYENRILAKEDFNDDTKDAGEIGAGHRVTALYELVPPELADKVIKPAVDESEFTKNDDDEAAPVVESNKMVVESDKTLVVRIRYKQPESSKSTRVDFPAIDTDQSFADASVDTRFTAAVAGFGMLLRESKFAGDWELADVLKVAKAAVGDDESELRAEFVRLVKKAKQLSGK